MVTAVFIPLSYFCQQVPLIISDFPITWEQVCLTVGANVRRESDNNVNKGNEWREG